MSATARMSMISVSGLTGFQVKQLGVGLHGGAPGVQVGGGDKGHFNAKSGRDIAQQLHGGAKQALRGHNMVAGRQKRLHRPWMAAMPLAVATARSPPSSAASRA